MSWCCGASKIGKYTTLEKNKVKLHNVPVLYCPVCHDLEPHPKIAENIDYIVDIALNDQLQELDVDYFLNLKEAKEDIFENCTTIVSGRQNGDFRKSQIDISLDLLLIAKSMKDVDWENQLMHRLNVLSKISKNASLNK